MKLTKFVQEGVFDKVKAESPVKMRLKDLTMSNVKTLSDKAFNEYYDYWQPRRDRVWKSMNEIQDNIKKARATYQYDFTKTEGKTGFVEDPYIIYGLAWIRAGSEGERIVGQLEEELKIYDQRYDKFSVLGQIFSAERKRRKTLKKKEGRKQAEGDWPSYRLRNPENTPSTIPSKIPRMSGLKPSLANPYFGRKGCKLDKQYAGHPAHYPYWSNDWKRRILAIEDVLTRNDKQGFEMMYAGTFVNSGNRFNFMIIGAGGNFLWRKYDPCPAAGQNDVYLNGKKMKTSTLEDWMSRQKRKVDTAIQAL